MPDRRLLDSTLSRFRIWVDQPTRDGITALKTLTTEGTSRLFGRGIALLWYAMEEKERGRIIVAMNPDGTDAREILQ